MGRLYWMNEDGQRKGVWKCSQGPAGRLELRPLTEAEFGALSIDQVAGIGVVEWRH